MTVRRNRCWLKRWLCHHRFGCRQASEASDSQLQRRGAHHRPVSGEERHHEYRLDGSREVPAECTVHLFPATEWACRRLRTSVPNVRYRRNVWDTPSKITSVMAYGAAVLNVNGRGSCASVGVPEESLSADERDKAYSGTAASRGRSLIQAWHCFPWSEVACSPSLAYV